MKWPEFLDHGGHPCPFPQERSREYAKYQRPADDPVCGECGCTVLYQENGQCVDCFAIASWRVVRNAPETYPTTAVHAEMLDKDYIVTAVPCPNGAHLKQLSLGSGTQCQVCKGIVSTKCPDCSTWSIVHKGMGPCRTCTPSPRATAIHAGATKYIPLENCPNCDTRALRRVDNGRCDQCVANALGVDKRTLKMDEATRGVLINAPDSVIDCATAITMGLTAFRTGLKCVNGHAGWRYVKGGACIDCNKSTIL